MANVTSLRWPELDKVKLSAWWIGKTSRFCVERRHEGNVRGQWVFKRGRMRNEWRCTSGGPFYLREHRSFENPRATDPAIIPDDVQLKARQFLSEQVALKPMVSRRGK